MDNSAKWIKGLLWFGAVYHMLLGLLGIFAKDVVVTLAKNFYNFNLTLDAQTSWILNPLAAYMFVFGVLMAVAASDPSKYKKIIYAAVGLLFLRVVQRIIFEVVAPTGLIQTIDPVKNSIDLILIGIYSIVVLVLTKKMK